MHWLYRLLSAIEPFFKNNINSVIHKCGCSFHLLASSSFFSSMFLSFHFLTPLINLPFSSDSFMSTFMSCICIFLFPHEIEEPKMVENIQYLSFWDWFNSIEFSLLACIFPQMACVVLLDGLNFSVVQIHAIFCLFITLLLDT